MTEMVLDHSRRQDLLGIQCLRAVAAFMVVIYHALGEWGRHTPGYAVAERWQNLSAGVDIFFVISGLVIALSVGRKSLRPHPAWSFIKNRIIRIIPLYWIMTTLKIVAVLAAPSLALRTRLNPLYILGSYALLPVHDWTGSIAPVLPVGWTLTYEMFFYLLVAAALLLRLPIARCCIPLLLVAGGSALVGSPDNFPQTIIIEFIFGILIGRSVERLQAIPGTLSCLAGVTAAAILLVAPGGDYVRPLTWGLPAACIVGSVVAAERPLRRILPRWLLAAGNASYATYLMPNGDQAGYYLAAWLMPANWSGLAVTIVAGLAICASAGQFVHEVIEKPLLRRLRRERPTQRLMQGVDA